MKLATGRDGLTYRLEPTIADVDHVRRIVGSTGFFLPSEVDVAVELVQERLSRGEASEYYFLFAQHGEHTVGYACYGPIACTLASFDLYWIAVESGGQRRGIGRNLLQQSEQLIKQAGGRRIYIETSNRELYRSTHRFYESCDYEREAVLIDFYRPGDDKVVYVKAI